MALILPSTGSAENRRLSEFLVRQTHRVAQALALLLLPPRLLRRFANARARRSEALVVPDLQRAAARSLRRRLKRNLQDAIAEGRARRRCVRALRQRYRPIEAAITALASIIALLAAGLLMPALALQGYRVLVDFH